MRRPLFRPGIRGHLFLAFGAVVAMTLVVTVVAWVSLARLGASLDRVVEHHLPALTAAAHLAEKGGVVVGTAPALAAATSDAQRQRVYDSLIRTLGALRHDLNALDRTVIDQSTRTALAELLTGLSTGLRDLDGNVRLRQGQARHKEEMLERLRWLSADFLDEVEPLIDDTRFNINFALNRTEPGPARLKAVAIEAQRQEALFRINADGSLLAELIGRAANLPDPDAVHATKFYFHEVEDRLLAELAVLAELPGILSLSQALLDIRGFATGEHDLFALRLEELAATAAGRALLDGNGELVVGLHGLISSRIEAETAAALAAAADSRQAIGRSRLLTAGAVAVSCLAALLVLWLYVGRNLIGRLTRLGTSMEQIAGGDLAAAIPVGGEDEIGRMADSLRTFRDTIATTRAELVQTAKLAALGQLTAGISHEINQPLTAIRHYARNTSILLEKGRNQETAANLAKISELSERSIRIINSLRSQARKPLGRVRPVDFRAVVENVLTLLERRTRAAGVAVSVTIPPTARWVLAGQVRLQQVLLNLCTNALDALADTADPALRLTASDAGEHVEFEVEDNGSGIAPDHSDKIFDPFFTTKEVGEGLGLGLSISYNIVLGFGGNLLYEPRPGGGSIFRLTVPRAEGEPA
jgi:two-component system, NtrC family, C4-dicarboxylate transport sensor histidine kinase DctB